MLLLDEHDQPLTKESIGDHRIRKFDITVCS